MNIRISINGGFEHHCSVNHLGIRECIQGFLKAHPPKNASQVPSGYCWTFDVWVNGEYQESLSFEVEGIG